MPSHMGHTVDDRTQRRWEWAATFGAPIAAGITLLLINLFLPVEYPPAATFVLFALLAAGAEWCQVTLAVGGATTFGPLVTIPAIAILGPVPATIVARYPPAGRVKRLAPPGMSGTRVSRS